jgi:hypothetical protein
VPAFFFADDPLAETKTLKKGMHSSEERKEKKEWKIKV